MSIAHFNRHFGSVAEHIRCPKLELGHVLARNDQQHHPNPRETIVEADDLRPAIWAYFPFSFRIPCDDRAEYTVVTSGVSKVETHLREDFLEVDRGRGVAPRCRKSGADR